MKRRFFTIILALLAGYPLAGQVWWEVPKTQPAEEAAPAVSLSASVQRAIERGDSLHRAYIRTRNTDGISLPGFIMMAVGCLAFVIQGFLTGNIYLLLTNLITFLCSVIIFSIKMHNDYFKKK